MKKILPSRRLFWFIKDGSLIDLSKPAMLDEYTQQVLLRGRFEDIKELLRAIEMHTFINSFNRIKQFLPIEIRRFWEDGIKGFNFTSREDS